MGRWDNKKPSPSISYQLSAVKSTLHEECLKYLSRTVDFKLGGMRKNNNRKLTTELTSLKSIDPKLKVKLKSYIIKENYRRQSNYWEKNEL